MEEKEKKENKEKSQKKLSLKKIKGWKETNHLFYPKTPPLPPISYRIKNR